MKLIIVDVIFQVRVRMEDEVVARKVQDFYPGDRHSCPIGSHNIYHKLLGLPNSCTGGPTSRTGETGVGFLENGKGANSQVENVGI